MHEIRLDDVTRGKHHSSVGKSRGRDVGVSPEAMGFEVHDVNPDGGSVVAGGGASGGSDETYEEISEPGELVRVRFDKFVQLVATHNFEQALKHHAQEDIIMNANLLMDLASAHEDPEPPNDKRSSILVGAGVVIGIVVAYLLFKFF